MELIEIIKSSIFLLSSLIVLLVIIVILYSKIRNQAKVKKVTGYDKSEGQKHNSDSQTLNKDNERLSNSAVENKNKKNRLVRNHPKFVVVNDNKKADFTQKFKINYHHNETNFDEDSN